MENKILNDQIKNEPKLENNDQKDIVKMNTFFDDEDITKQKEAVEPKIEDLKDIYSEKNVEEKKEPITNVVKENLDAVTLTSPVSDSSQMQKDIQDIILKDGTGQLCATLNEGEKANFEKNLYSTSKKIEALLLNTKNKISKLIRKIFILIKKLLQTLKIKDYGFLEKTVKNKVSEIIKLKKE